MVDLRHCEAGRDWTMGLLISFPLEITEYAGFTTASTNYPQLRG